MRRSSVAAVVMVSFCAGVASGQTIVPPYDASYSYFDLGTAPGVPVSYGGLTILPGSPNTLLLGGGANSATGAIYAVGLVRDAGGHITGFTGTTTEYCSAPYNDGGVTFGPDGVLFASRWPVNELAQYLPGSTTPDSVINLALLGVAQSNSAVAFVPPTMPGAGRMKLSSWSGGQFYDATFAPGGSGTFDILSVSQTATLVGGPEGVAYVPPGSPLFPAPSLIVSEYSWGIVSAYDIGPTGDPIESTRREFMTGLFGAEGAHIDPVTGDFLFSTFGGGARVVVVRGFVVAPTCDGDVNCDFALDGFDVEAQEKAVGGDLTDYCLRNPDFNGDFALDGFDVEAVELIVGGGPCP